MTVEHCSSGSTEPQVAPVQALNQKSLEDLRQSLPPLAARVEASGLIRDFNRYYGIDFEDRLAGVRHYIGAVSSGKYKLAVHCWTTEGARSNLLLVHGYTDHTGLFGHLIRFGLRSGCNVVAFDLPGHGLSSGESAAIDDFADYSQAIVNVMTAAVVPDLPWWVIAQSTGCSALIDYAGKHPWKFTSVVFLAPLIRPVSWNKVRIGHILLHRFRETIARKFTENSGDPEFLVFMQNDPLASHHIPLRWIAALRHWLAALEFKDLGVGPLLVIQGDADATVDWRYNMEHIVELFPQARIEYLPGAGHHLANETETCRQLYLEKVAQFIALE